METWWYYLNLIKFKDFPKDKFLMEKDGKYRQLSVSRHYGLGYRYLRDLIEETFSDSRIYIPNSDFWDDWDPNGQYRNWTIEERENLKTRLLATTYYHTPPEPLKPLRDKRIPIEGEKKCRRCDKIGVPLERDHIQALHLGGKDETANLQWLCYLCHKFKTTEDHLKVEIDHHQKESWRRKMWEYRLEVHRKLNPLGAEEYHSYGEDRKTLWNYWSEFRITPSKRRKPDQDWPKQGQQLTFDTILEATAS